MTKLSDAAAQSAAVKRNQSEWLTVSDVSVPERKPPSKGGKLGQQKKG